MKSNFSSSVLTAVLLLLLSLSAMAQYTETVIHSFSGSDGIGPQGLIADSHGNLYGTAPTGGNSGAGVVFELSPPGTGSGPWMETVLHSFTGGSDGGTPVVGLTLDSRGNLYGAANGGTPTSGSNGCVPGQGCGVVYELSPPLSGSGPWTQTILYSFAGGTDGSNPVCLAMSPGGDLFGVLRTGGPAGLGSVFELSPPGSGSGAWTKTVLFDEGGAFSYPFVFDRQGNVYGTLQPSGYGTVFEFSPPAGGSGAWTVSSLYSFKGGTDGDGPVGSLLLDSQGNLYGATTYGGATYFCTWLDNIGCGEIFELSPPGAGGGAWTKTVPYIFSSSNGIYPSGGVTSDAVGNLYGTTSTGGDTSSCIGTYVSGCGIVFKLYPLAGSFGTWTEVVPYIFTGGTDGAEPDSGLIVDSHGNLYGTANSGGVSGDGVVFELSPHTTTTSLASSANPSVIGQDVLFTATVSPAGTAAPTGSVSFMAGGSIIGGCSGVVLSPSLTATCSTVTLPLGTNTVTAIYWGDSTYAGSTGVLAQVVTTGSASSQTTLSSSINPSTKGQSVTLTATVDPAGPPIPTGTVSFTSNAVDISGCTAVALSSSRTATCTATALPVGTDAMIAAYSGDANYSSSSGALSQLVNPVPTAVQFVPVSPCRVVDTRTAEGPFGGPELAAGTTRSFTIPAGPCAGIPSTAVAYSLNITVVPPAPLGYLTIWPTGEGQPAVSTLNSLDGRVKANAAIVPAGTSGAVSVYVNNASNVLLDIDGYFAAGSSSSLEFYPLAPCRLVDTRQADGPLGGPSLVAATERDFPILSGSCGIPGTAMAYSLNFTVVPPATGDALEYLTVWPEGETRPVVSTLNNFTGTIVANAAIVPAGATGGEVAVYPSDATNLLIDVNGYFAAPGTGGYNLYTLTPCRVLDTRKTTGAFTGELAVNVATSTCAPSSSDKAYVFNATVVPSGDLGYLTLWPDGETQPVVSTLNAADGAITSNMAIVPNGDGKTDAYASGTTQLVLDISAYFAP